MSKVGLDVTGSPIGLDHQGSTCLTENEIARVP